MMKKTIGILLAAAMIFTSLAAVGAEERVENKAVYKDVKSTDKCFNATGLLSRLNIMDGYEDGTFKPENKLTRAEFTKLAVSLLGDEEQKTAEQNSGRDTIFDDVKADHWAAGYITAAAASGIIKGMGNGKFEPESYVTYAQAMKMLVCAAGFEQWSLDMGGWPSGYMYWGGMLKISADTGDFDVSYEISREQTAIMLKNTLNVPLCVNTGKASYDLYGNMYMELEMKDGTGKDWQTMLTKHGIYAVEGYMDKSNVFVITSAKNFLDEKIDSEKRVNINTSYGSENLNKSVEAYIKVNGNDSCELIYMH